MSSHNNKKEMILRSGFVKIQKVPKPKSSTMKPEVSEAEEKELLEMQLLILILEKAREVCDISQTPMDKVIDIGISKIVIPDGIDIENVRISAMRCLSCFIG